MRNIKGLHERIQIESASLQAGKIQKVASKE